MAKDIPSEERNALYGSQPYLDAYTEHTQRRVAIDPHEAIGGMWEGLGRLQFDYLVKQGLQPRHTLLDVGCGTLRGGRHFIRYLDAGKYTGFDLSPAAIAYADQLVDAEGLRAKRPRLFVNEDRALRFTSVAGQAFDFILAHSVFTHLPPEHIIECFDHLRRVMAPHSWFFFTFRPAPEARNRTVKDFDYPFSFFEALATERDFRIALDGDYPHPRDQRMARLRLKA